MKISKKYGILFLSLALVGCSFSNKKVDSSQSTVSDSKIESKQTKNTPSSQKISESQNTKTSFPSEEEIQALLNEIDLRAITDLILEDYISSYDPLTEDWEAFPLDGIDLDGQIIEAPDVYLIITEAYVDELDSLQTVYVLFTFYPDKDNYIEHFVSIGDSVFENDGYLNELYKKYSGSEL